MPPQEVQQPSASDGTLPELELPVDEKPPKGQLSFSHVESEVDSFVRADWSLRRVLEYFFESADAALERGDRDTTFVVMAYSDKCLAMFPQKSSAFIDELVARRDEAEIGAFFAAVDEHSRLGENLELGKFLPQVFGAEAFAHNLVELSELSQTRVKKEVVFRAVAGTFKDKLLAAPTLPGELAVYRTLVVSTRNTQLSDTFVEALKKLWKAAIAENEHEEIDLKPDGEEPHFEHHLFAQAVDSLLEEVETGVRKKYFSLDFVRKEIQGMFVPLSYRVFEEDGHKVLETSGRKVILSAVLPKIEMQLEKQPDVTQLRFSAVNEVLIDQSLKQPGLSVSVVAPTVTIRGIVQFDLSGTDAPDNDDVPKAANGQQKGEDGKDGVDGIAGGSAGHFVLHAAEVVNADSLQLIQNGGNGNKGQDGGDGSPGEDGYGEKFDQVFSADEKSSMVWKSAGNALTGGLGYRMAGAFERCMMSSGTVRVTNQSSYYLSSHIISYFEGTAGQPGGQGGRNGCGGEGGKKGECTIINTTEGGEPFPVKHLAKDGADGIPGKPGKTGQYGKEGWDVGLTRRSMEDPNEYGRNHNQKFEINYSSKYTSDRVYIKALYNGSGSYCYATIAPRKRRIQQMLQDHEKTRQRKTDAERKGDAIARKCTAINTQAIEEKYAQLTQTSEEQELSVSADKESEAQLNRLAVRIDVPKEPMYEELAPIPDSSDSAWNSVKVQLSKEESLSEKQKRMALLSKFRHDIRIQRTSKGEFARIIMQYLRSQKAVEASKMQLAQLTKAARLVRELEANSEVNCSLYMMPFRAEIKGYSACVDIMFDETRAKEVIERTLKSCSELRLHPVKWNALKSLIDVWMEDYPLQGEPIRHHWRTIENAFDALQQNFQVDEGLSVVKNLLEKSPEKEALFEAEKTFAESIESIFALDKLKVSEKVNFPGGKLLLALFTAKKLVSANSALALALKLVCEMSSNEKELVEKQYSFDYPNVMDYWLTIAGNDEHLTTCAETIKEAGTKSAAGRLLIAWETKTNVRIYHNQMLIENHFPEGNHAHHIALKPEDGAFQLLTFKLAQVELCHERALAAANFRRDLERTTDETIALDASGFVASLNAAPEDTAALVTKVAELVAHLNVEPALARPLKRSVKLFCDEFPHHGTLLLNTLNAVFAAEGCFIDSERLRFLFDTLFDSCLLGNDRPFLLPGLLLARPQAHWTDECFVMSAEDSLGHKIRRSGELRARLGRIHDDRLKILCATKLKEEPLDETRLFEVLELLKDARLAYPELRTVPVDKWAEIVQGTHVYNLMRVQPCRLPENERHVALFWCCKLAEVFGGPEALAVFRVLASQQTLGSEKEPLQASVNGADIRVSPSILGRLVQRVCNNEIVSGSESTSPANIFWTIWNGIQGAQELPKEPRDDEEWTLVPEAAAELLTPPEASKARELKAILGIMRKSGEKSVAYERASALLAGPMEDEKDKEKAKKKKNGKHDGSDSEDDDDDDDDSDDESNDDTQQHTWQETTTRYDPYRNCFVTETRTFTAPRRHQQSTFEQQRQRWEKQQRRQQKAIERQNKHARKQWEEQCRQIEEHNRRVRAENERRRKEVEKHNRKVQREVERRNRQMQKEVARRNRKMQKQVAKANRQNQLAVERYNRQMKRNMIMNMKNQMRMQGFHGQMQIVFNGQPMMINVNEDEPESDEEQQEEEDEEEEESEEEEEDDDDEEEEEEEQEDEFDPKTGKPKTKAQTEATKTATAATQCAQLATGQIDRTQMTEAVSSHFPKDTDQDYALLMTVDEVILAHRGFRLRDNQKLAVLCALKSDGSLLQQIATGEGKSLIIAAISIISVLKGHTVTIVSSSSTLAKRDVESPAPKGCTDLYAAFGLSAAHVCMEDADQRQNVYATSDIVYGDLTSFQRDYLLDTFYGMNIVGGRKFDVILVDEVDSMLLDQGSNMLYLSHEIPDFEWLQPVFVKVWQLVNAAVASKQELTSAEMVKRIRAMIFHTLDLDALEPLLGCTEFEAKHLRLKLLEAGIVHVDGTFASDDVHQICAQMEKVSDLTAQTKSRLLFAVRQLFDQQKLGLPRHLQDFVKRHLEQFVDNAQAAMFMHEGEGYQVDCAHLDSSISYEPRIIIVEQGTGVDLPTTQWSNGLHQFLQLKHGCRLSAVSLKAVFVSNVSFLKKFDHLYGFSGTLGAQAERQQLAAMYNLECVSIPSSLPKLLYEETSVVADTHPDWVQAVTLGIAAKLRAGRAVLVICESIRQVNDLSADVKAYARKHLQEERETLRNIENALLYRRDRETFAYGEGTKSLEAGRVIFSTNLAGRGTDIKLCPEVVANGGLHVIVAFLPDNIRVEEQAFGRAARCGEPGTAELIVQNDQEAGCHVSRMKIHRNAEEVKRIQAVSSFYDKNIKVEEDCFEHFAAVFKSQSAQLDAAGLGEEMKQVLTRDLLDRWADWLDTQPRDESIPSEHKISQAEKFVQTLSLPGNRPLRPLNRLRCGVLEALEKRYAEATSDFDYIIANFPDFCTEAKYYKGFLIVKQTEITSRHDSAYLQAKLLFDSAWRGFTARADACQRDRSIIANYQQKEDQTRFAIDVFNQQQLETARLMQMFAQSVEGLVGGRVDPGDFQSDMSSEEAAHKTFQALLGNGIDPGHFAMDFDAGNIDNFCKANLVKNENVLTALKEAQRSGRTVLDMLGIRLVQQPLLEDFWNELKQQNFVHDVKQHAFLNAMKVEKLNPALADQLEMCRVKVPEATDEAKNGDESVAEEEDPEKPPPPRRVFMHSMVEVDSEHWFELDLHQLTARVPQNAIRTLTDIGALVFSDSALLNLDRDPKTVKFSQFCSITKSHFLDAGLPPEELTPLLTKLCEAEFLVTDAQSDSYLLGPEADLEKADLVQCLVAVVEQLVKVRFAFVLTYRGMRAAHDAGQPVKLQLSTRNEAAASVMDLVDSGVFEHCNVNFKALGGAGNVEAVLSGVRAELNSYIVQPPSSAQIVNNYSQIGGSEAAEKIVQQFKSKSGMDKFETVDAKLVEIWKRLGDANLAALRDTSLYTTHAATHIIEFMEKKWSSKTLWKIGLVAAFALAQLAVGAAIMMFSAGSGVFVSKFLISEGISDLIFAIKGACTGYAGSYLDHKKVSVLSTGLMCGVGAIVAWGSHFNSLAHSLVGPGATAAGGAKVMSLAGTALFKQVGFMNVLWAAVKSVAAQVISSLANLAIFTIMQQGLQRLIQTAIAKAREYIMSFLSNWSGGAGRLRATMTQVLMEFGVADGTRIANECGSYVLSAKNKMDDWMGRACDFIFNKYRHLFVGVCSGLQQGAAQAHNIGALVMKALSMIPTLLMAGQLVQMVQSMVSRLTGIHGEIDCVLGAQFAAKKAIRDRVRNKPKSKDATANGKDAKAPKPPSEQEVATEVEKLLGQWEKQLSSEVDQAIETRIATPLLSMLASKVEGYMESAVKAAYEKVCEWRDERDLARFKAQYEAERGPHGQNEKAAWGHYEKRLNHLMERTRSPEVMRDIIANCSKIDMTTASAAGNVLMQAIGGPVRMVIRDENGNYFEHVSGAPPEAAKTVNVDLRKEHFGAQTVQSGRNSCLFDALSASVPEFHNVVHNDKDFRHMLGKVITHDPYYRLHIESGWQSISVQQDHIGGQVAHHHLSAVSNEAQLDPKMIQKAQQHCDSDKKNHHGKCNGLVPKVEKDEHGKVVGMTCRIDAKDVWQYGPEGHAGHKKVHGGTPTHQSHQMVEQAKQETGHTHLDAGHLVPKNVGGSGCPENTFVENTNANRGQHKSFEYQMAKMLKSDPDNSAYLNYHKNTDGSWTMQADVRNQDHLVGRVETKIDPRADGEKVPLKNYKVDVYK